MLLTAASRQQTRKTTRLRAIVSCARDRSTGLTKLFEQRVTCEDAAAELFSLFSRFSSTLRKQSALCVHSTVMEAFRAAVDSLQVCLSRRHQKPVCSLSFYIRFLQGGCSCVACQRRLIHPAILQVCVGPVINLKACQDHRDDSGHSLMLVMQSKPLQAKLQLLEEPPASGFLNLCHASPRDMKPMLGMIDNFKAVAPLQRHAIPALKRFAMKGYVNWLLNVEEFTYAAVQTTKRKVTKVCDR